MDSGVRWARIFASLLVLLSILNLVSCGPEAGEIVLSRPDEYRYVFEAKEAFVLKAIVLIFEEKSLGQNVIVDREKQTVATDYIVQNDWRIKALAQVKRLNWKETEVLLSVTSERKTGNGWEGRRLLEKEQYMRIFSVIESKVYEEMYRAD